MRLFSIAALCLISVPAAAQDAGEGRLLYESFCAACHGEAGRGDGRMAPILSILPPDLTQIAARNDGVFPVFATARQIDGRDPLLAHGGEMPIFGRWFDSSMRVTINEASGQPVMMEPPIADMVAYLMSIQE